MRSSTSTTRTASASSASAAPTSSATTACTATGSSGTSASRTTTSSSSAASPRRTRRPAPPGGPGELPAADQRRQHLGADRAARQHPRRALRPLPAPERGRGMRSLFWSLAPMPALLVAYLLAPPVVVGGVAFAGGAFVVF